MKMKYNLNVYFVRSCYLLECNWRQVNEARAHADDPDTFDKMYELLRAYSSLSLQTS